MSRYAAYLPEGTLDLLEHPGRAALRQGAMLFCDIDGFTSRTEMLAGRGDEGAEIISETVNRLFTRIIQAVHSHRGVVLKFGGDALFCLFSCGDMTLDCLRAAQCAGLIHRSVSDASIAAADAGAGRLSVSSGLHAGPFVDLIMGDRQRMDRMVFGPAVNELPGVRARAAAGEALCSAPFFEKVGGRVAAAPVSDCYRLGLELSSAPSMSFTLRPPPAIDPGVIAPFLPDGLLERFPDGRVTSEHRHAAIMFVGCASLDDPAGRVIRGEAPLSELAEQADRLYRRVAEMARAHRLSLHKVDLDARGFKLMLAAGVPSGSAEDPLNAVSALLEVRGLAAEHGLRAGLETGFVACVEVGHPGRREYTVMGDVVNTAARLMASLPDGEIACGRGALEAAGGRFVFIPAGAVAVRGKTGALQRWTPAGPAGTETSDPPLRQAETEQLVKLVVDRAGSAVLTGAPGMGRTAVLRETARIACERGVTSLLIAADRRSHPYRLVRKIMTADLGAGGRPDTGTEWHQVEPLLAARCGAEPELLRQLPLIGMHVFDAERPSDRPAPISRPAAASLFSAIETYLSRIAFAGRDRPVLVCLDDVQLLPEDLSALVARLMTAPGGIAWLAASADDEFERHTGPAVPVIRLGPLSLAGTEALARRIDRDGRLDPEALRQVHERSGGNPLYVEVTVRYLTERGGGDGPRTSLPDTLHGIVAARFDELDEEIRIALRAGAAIGRRFSAQLLDQLLKEEGASVPNLEPAVRAGVLRRDDGPAGAGYLFAAPLLHEVVYRSLHARDRRRIHLRLAELLERQTDRPDAVRHDATGHHWLAAGMAGRAALQFERAADLYRAQGLSAAARPLYREALAAAGQAGMPEIGRLRLKAGQLEELAGRPAEATAHFRAAHELACSAGDTAGRVAALAGLSRACLAAGEIGPARQASDEALSLLGNVHSRELEAEAYFARGLVAMRRSEYDDALDWLKRSSRLFVALGHVEGHARVHGSRAAVLTSRGQHAEAEEQALEALGAFRASGNLFHQARTLITLGSIRLDRGDLDGAREAFRESGELADRTGDPACAIASLSNLGMVAWREGRADEALSQFAIAHRLAVESGDLAGAGGIRGNIGLIHAGRHRPDLALEAYVEALQAAEARDDRPQVARWLQNIGAALRERGEFEPSLRKLQAAAAVLAERNDREALALIHIHEAYLLSGLGRGGQARERLERAGQAAAGSDNRLLKGLWQLHSGRLSFFEGDPAAAVPLLREARALAQQSGFRDGVSLADLFLTAALDATAGGGTRFTAAVTTLLGDPSASPDLLYNSALAASRLGLVDQLRRIRRRLETSPAHLNLLDLAGPLH